MTTLAVRSSSKSGIFWPHEFKESYICCLVLRVLTLQRHAWKSFQQVGSVRIYVLSSGRERRVWKWLMAVGPTWTPVKLHLNTGRGEPSHRPGHELREGLLAGRPLWRVISCCSYVFWVGSRDPAVSLETTQWASRSGLRPSQGQVWVDLDFPAKD